jgi:hypothetical protein
MWHEWGRTGRCILYWWEIQRERDCIGMDLGEMGWGGVDWAGLAEDRDKWRALVNSVLNLWVP